MQILRPAPSALATALLLAVAACGDVAEAPVRAAVEAAQALDVTGEARLGVHPWLPIAEVSATTVRAGETLTVRCPPADPVAGRVQAPIQPLVEPAMQVSQSSSLQHSYVAERVGTHAIFCASGAARSAARTVEVVAGEPVVVAVLLQKIRVVAGEASVARCEGYDRAGNAVVPPSADVRLGAGESAPQAAFAMGGTLTGARFSVSAPMQMQALDGRTLQLTGESAGDVEVRCSVPEWSHLPSSEPATLQIAAGAPTHLVAEVAQSNVRAHAEAPVACRAYDRHNNLVPDYPAQLTATGPGSTEVNGTGFVADVAGNYEVVCQGPATAAGEVLRSAPQPVVVAAGVPARWRVNLYQQVCVSQNSRLQLTWNVFDDYNNPVHGVEVDLETSPRTPIKRDASGGFVFPEEGVYDILVRPLGEAAARLQPWPEHITVDSTPPMLEITSPARGAMVASADKVQMLVGTVRDSVSTLKSLSINGVPQVLQPGSHSHAFSVAHESPWGLSVIHAVAEDACGNVATLKQSYQRSASFGPVVDGPHPDARVAQGIRAAMAQPLWDDGDPTGGHDISNLLQRALQGGGLDERLPHNLAAMTTFMQSRDELGEVVNRCIGVTHRHKENGTEVVRAGKITMDGPNIEFLHVEEGGVHLALSFENLNLPISLNTYLALPCGPSMAKKLGATLVVPKLRIEVRGQIRMVDGVVQVALCPSCVHATFEGAAPALVMAGNDGSGPQVGQRVLDWLFARSTKSLTDALQNRVRQDVVREAERLLQNLHIDHSLPLPLPMDANAAVSSGVDNIVLRGGEQGGGTSEASLFTQVVAPIALSGPDFVSPVPMPPLRGAIRQEAGTLLPLDLASSDTFAVSIRDEMLNQMMWSLWASGMFHGIDPWSFVQSGSDKRESHLLDAAQVRLYFTSPPIVMPSDTPGEVLLGVGDVYAEIEVDTYKSRALASPVDRGPLAAKFYFSTVLRAKLGVDPERRTLRVDPVGHVKIDLQVIDSASPAMYLSVTQWLEKAINKFMPSLLAKPLVAFPLPTLQIGQLPGIPDDAAWRLEDADLERPAGAQDILLRGRLAPLPQALDDATK